MLNIYNGLQEFLGTGGNVLFVIMLLAFAMWTFIFERMAYYLFAHKPTKARLKSCLLYTSPSPRDQRGSRMPSSA